MTKKNAGRGETWLVATTTRAAFVNLVCAAATGTGAIDRLLFLRGIDPRRHNQGGHTTAERDRDWLLNALRHEMAGKALPYEEIESAVNDPYPWVGALGDFFGPGGKGQGARRIVYVYTGGTKDMSLGAWLGLTTLKNSRPDLSVEFISKQESRIFWPMEQRAIPLTGGASRVSLAGYLIAHGYDIVNEATSREREQLALARKDGALALGDALLRATTPAKADAWITLFNRLGQKEECVVSEVVQAHTPGVSPQHFSETVGPLLKKFEPRSAIALSNGRWIFRRGSGVHKQLFEGDWLEDWLWLRAREALAGTAAEVRHDIRIRRSGASASGHDFQIDLAILANDQLHVGEAKSLLSDGRAAIDRLVALRKAVADPYGRAWMLCGEHISEAAQRRELAAHNAIEFAAGVDEIDAKINGLPAVIG